MLGSVYNAGDLPFDIPDIKSSSELSEDEQFSIIDRAINGDLKGIIPVTQEDIDLYNRKKYEGSYANEYRRATEFSYVPKHKQEQVKRERAQAMGMPPPIPQQPVGYPNASPMGNPVLSGYQSFANPYPQYQYPNTFYNAYNQYAGYGYYGGYYGGYNPYQGQPDRDFGNPVLNYAFSRINQFSSMPNYNTYGYYNYYNQPKPQTFEVRPNQPVSSVITQYASNMPAWAVQDSPIQQNWTYPEGFESPIVISMPPEIKQRVLATGYYNQPPYARTEQYRNFVNQERAEQAKVIETINRTVYGDEEYERRVNEQKIKEQEAAAAEYQRRHMYDATLGIKMTPEQQKLKADEAANMNRVMANFRYNPYNISFSLVDGWNRILSRINNNKAVQKVKSFFKPDRTAIEFLTEDYPKYKSNKDFEDFCREARIGFMEYDADKYRSALVRSGISATPYLGFRPTYDPITQTQVNMASAPQSIAERYNERRNSYIREAEKRGGVV